MELVVALALIIVVLLLCLVPAWLGLLAYDYIAQQAGWVVFDVTFWNVLAVAVVIWILSAIFKTSK